MRGIELTPEDPIDHVVELADAAEAVGFDTAFASCHYNNRDPFIALDRMAAATETIRLGPGVANPYDTHPAALASRMATLAEVSDGRAAFGIGAGDRSTLENIGIERSEPLRRVLETIDVARSLWAGERVDHEGTFRTDAAGLNYDVPSSIPIYVGAQGPDMIRMAAKHAAGVLVNASHPADVGWAADRVQEGLDGRERDTEFDFAATVSASVACDAEAAIEAARAPVAFIAAGAEEPVLDRHGIDPELAAKIRSDIKTGQFSRAFGRVTDAMLDAFCVAGTPDRVADRFDALLEHADSIVVSAPLGPDQATAVRLLGDVFNSASR